MNAISMLLVIAAAAALITSFFQEDDLTLVYVSIACCLGAFLFLFLGLLRGKPQRKPVLAAEAPPAPAPPAPPPAAPAQPAAAPTGLREPVILPRLVEEPPRDDEPVVLQRSDDVDDQWRRESQPDVDDTAQVRAQAPAPETVLEGPVVAGPEADEGLWDDEVEDAPPPAPAPVRVAPRSSARSTGTRSGATRSGATRAGTPSAGAAGTAGGAGRGAAAGRASAGRAAAATGAAAAPTGPSERDVAKVEQVLRGVAGIGPTRRRDLLAHFGTYRRLKNANVTRLTEVPGITPTLAERVRAALDEA